MPILKMFKREPNEEVVRDLEWLLAEAKKGEVTGLVFVATMGDSYSRGRPGHWASTYGLLGAAEMLKMEVVSFLQETSKPVEREER